MLKVEEEPASPTARLLQAQQLNVCIIARIGYNTSIDANLYQKCVCQTLLKHPRFSCLLVNDRGRCSWRRTTVDIGSHVINVPDLDPNMESSDQFVEDFASDLSKIPLDMTKPPWEIHILNVKTSDANATTFFKLHHSMGDGVSLMALLHACAEKISDPKSLPVSVIPTSRKHRYGADRGFMKMFFALVSTMFCFIFNSLVDGALFLATMMFLKDTETPIKAAGGVVLPYKRFVHRIVSLDEVKLVKTSMNVSVNDVVVGVTEAGLSHYLNKTYKEQRENGAEKNNSTSLPKHIRLRSTVVFNLRPTPTIEDLAEIMEKEELNGTWGNRIAIVLLPFTIHLPDDPLTHIRRAKSNMDKKKLSLGHKSAFFVMKLMMMLFGTEMAASATQAIFRNTTLTFSNVMGPKEEVKLFGHALGFIAPSVYGFPQSLIVHYQSYANKLIISIGADEKLIPNPHQLCDDLVKALGNIKEAVINRGLGIGDHLC